MHKEYQINWNIKCYNENQHCMPTNLIVVLTIAGKNFKTHASTFDSQSSLLPLFWRGAVWQSGKLSASLKLKC